MENYISGIGICAGSMMVKWDLLNQHIHNHRIRISPGDNINVFINLECVLKNLSLQKNLPVLVNGHKQKVVIELESAILNLMANYRMYFKKEKCNVKMYFYFTDLDEHPQQMAVYNKY